MREAINAILTKVASVRAVVAVVVVVTGCVLAIVKPAEFGRDLFVWGGMVVALYFSRSDRNGNGHPPTPIGGTPA